MNNFWDTVVKPVIESVCPEVVVEIGIFSGINTKNILESFDAGMIVHAIDPSPMPNVDRLVKEHAGRLTLHRDTSLNVLPSLPEFQVGIIDGDHNWYTVYHELRLIEEKQGRDDRFPVLLLHDVAWPYGRRDLYYDPTRIPDEFRHEFSQRGILWGESELAENAGLNRQLMNAVREGGPRNGVLTAIEDFIAQSPIAFEFIRIPAYFGVGILVPRSKKTACPRLGEFLDELTGPLGLIGIIESLEAIRAKANVQQQETDYELNRLKKLQAGNAPLAAEVVSKPVTRATNLRPCSLSVVLILFNMRREAQRTLHSLSRKYQQGVEDLNYEVIVVDNGSSDPVGEAFVRQFGDNFFYLHLENAPASPARAINLGVDRSRGKVLAIMIDGAHVLTPRVLYYAMNAFQLYPNPVVAPRYWFTGPGQQGETVRDGYDSNAEDRLFEKIDWPNDGYRLFEIGVFIGPGNGWMSRFFESNCLFMQRPVFDAIGGANERFDYPGGGFLNLDMMREAAERKDTTLVTLLGEATFHQVHGGITTNALPEVREERVAMYRAQYRKIREREYGVPDQPVEVLGHRPDTGRHQLAFRKK